MVDGRPLPDWLRLLHGLRLWGLANRIYRNIYGMDCPIPPWGHR